MAVCVSSNYLFSAVTEFNSFGCFRVSFSIVDVNYRRSVSFILKVTYIWFLVRVGQNQS